LLAAPRPDPLRLKDLHNHQKSTSEVRSQMNAFFEEVLKPA
jgi:hypothetical protein